MATLVLYATKTGAVKQCANVLAEELPGSILCNIETGMPDLAAFDSVIVGAGVRDGKIYKPIRDYIKKNKDALLGKRAGYFICNEKPKKTEEIIEANFSEELRQAAVGIESFGGYKSYAAPAEGADQLKGLFVDRIKAFSDLFK
ncbi:MULTISPECIES: flavodoxin domain-containing protein [unclassified Paenibacillus]|uniref:flavodoxin domain-containing protein n=1 Tax=unclassified Paenibacillus TaxID=185978 RepID=UPI0009566CB6|nr:MULTISPECIES: flavodoxin domain-containing protein [unclassified Paenibacillus]ASS64785.1 flavodoxin [Paenibacillus sp. RUD330]SIR06092.1 menaquinone-dependent protoporphyrinogen oxidase [Paenibacillus sp. RU4X]SIR29381.1 menaquinone-dependent protoporphyrinogen oxidase [Paenibacillus sp. RU4T]